MSLPLPLLFEALTLAAEKHKYQRRSGDERLPYINHLLKVTDALIRVGGETEADLLLAALFHDIIEDTDLTEEELSRRFGPKVGRTVAELSDDMELAHAQRKRLQVERAGTLSSDARKIRIADKASNILDILAYPIDWPEEKKRDYVINAVQIVNQIRGINPRLEAWFDEVVAEAAKKLDIDNSLIANISNH